MNKKCVTIVGGAVAGILALTGCQDDTYTYEVSGTIEGRQIDYDCPGEDVAMDAVAFAEGKGRSTGSSGKKKDSGSSSSEKKGSGSSKKPGSGGQSQSATKSASPKASVSATPKNNKGVKLSKKPDKPEKIKGGKVPKPLYLTAPKGCETEYELYIRNNDGLFEQDVRKQDYDVCTEGEKFAACTDD